MMGLCTPTSLKKDTWRSKDWKDGTPSQVLLVSHHQGCKCIVVCIDGNPLIFRAPRFGPTVPTTVGVFDTTRYGGVLQGQQGPILCQSGERLELMVWRTFFFSVFWEQPMLWSSHLNMATSLLEMHLQLASQLVVEKQPWMKMYPLIITLYKHWWFSS